MSSNLNLALTDELRAFINQNSGDGTLYSTPGEFVRAMIREKKDRLEAARIRAAVIDGYGDAIAGRLIPFSGDLQADMEQFEKIQAALK